MGFDQPIQFTQPVGPQTPGGPPLLYSSGGSIITPPANSGFIDVTSFNSFFMLVNDNQGVATPPPSGIVIIDWTSDKSGAIGTFIKQKLIEVNSVATNDAGVAYISGPMYGPFMRIRLQSGSGSSIFNIQVWGSQIFLTKITAIEHSESDFNSGTGSDGKLIGVNCNTNPGTNNTFPMKMGQGPGHVSMELGGGSSTSTQIKIQTNLNSGAGNSSVWTLISTTVGRSYWLFDITMPARACYLTVNNLDTVAGHVFQGNIAVIIDPE